ncbi:IS110 family transposase [Streptomyces sp. NBC_00631]|uniref:IS110 family transposase n=1 Tax=Streptomyces sp. NBC_00631 TaxID=2975793 RepID=UPI0030E321D5
MPYWEGEFLLTGDDWAEDHHDIEVQEEAGRQLAMARLPEGVEGIAKLHELFAKLGGEDLDPAGVMIGLETDPGTWVQALPASGYRLYAVNPRQAARFKERHASSGAKSDKGDAHAFADMVRVDRDQLRPVAGTSEQVQAVKAVACTHQAHSAAASYGQRGAESDSFHPPPAHFRLIDGSSPAHPSFAAVLVRPCHIPGLCEDLRQGLPQGSADALILRILTVGRI